MNQPGFGKPSFGSPLRRRCGMNRGCSGPALGLSLCPSVPWQCRASSRCLSRRGDSGDSRYRLQGPRCSRSCRRRAFTAGCFSNSVLYPIMRNEQRPGAQPSPRDGSRSLPRALASCPRAGRVPPCPGGSGPVADARQGRGRAGGGRAAGSFAHQKRLCLRAPPALRASPAPVPFASLPRRPRGRRRCGAGSAPAHSRTPGRWHPEEVSRRCKSAFPRLGADLHALIRPAIHAAPAAAGPGLAQSRDPRPGDAPAGLLLLFAPQNLPQVLPEPPWSCSACPRGSCGRPRGMTFPWDCPASLLLAARVSCRSKV